MILLLSVNRPLVKITASYWDTTMLYLALFHVIWPLESVRLMVGFKYALVLVVFVELQDRSIVASRSRHYCASVSDIN